MAERENLPIPEDPDFNLEIGGLQPDDPVHFGQMNSILARLLTNEAFLEKLAGKMVEKALISHVLDSANPSMVLGADQAPELTKLIDVERKRIGELNSNLGNFEGRFNFLSADSVHFDAVNNSAYFKTVKDDKIYQFSAEPNVLAYNLLDATGWHSAWNVGIFNILGFDAFYDPEGRVCIFKWRIRNDLHYQLIINGSIIGFDCWDGVRWTRLWTK